MRLYFGKLVREDGSFYLVATDEGLYYVGSKNSGVEEIERWIKRKYPQAKLIEDYSKVKKYANQLSEYMDGKREVFDLNIILKGTAFQEAVWKELQAIPFGETRSYSDIAKNIGRQKAVRAVGSAIGANPLAIIVPCHRVISKSGALSGFRGGIDMKIKLLEIEGINFH